MKIENRQQLLAFVALGMVGVLVFINVIGGPMVDGWKRRAKDIEEMRAQIERGENSLKRVNMVRERWTQMQTNTLSAADAERRMFEAFQNWARSSRVTISSIQRSWRQNDDDYMTLECQANATGSMGSLAQFVYNLEKDPMALRVENLEITARDENGQTLALALQVSGLVLTAPPK